MKELNEYTAELHRRIEAETAHRRELRRRVTAVLLTVIPLTLVSVFAVNALLLRLRPSQQTVVSTESPDGAARENTAAALESTDALPTYAAAEPDSTPDGTLPNETDAGVKEDFDDFLPLPSTNEVVVTGELLTDEEAEAHLAEYILVMANRGVVLNAPRITGGYHHLYYGDGENKVLELRRDFRDYLLYDGDQLIEAIELIKDHGVIYDYSNRSKDRLADYDAFLQAHKGERLLHIYAGLLELVLAPDGTVFSPEGFDVSGIFDELEQPYDWFSANLPEDAFAPLA